MASDRPLAVQPDLRRHKLVQEHGRIEHMPAAIRDSIGASDLVEEIRQLYLQPEVTSAFDVHAFEPDRDAVVQFLCEEREFGRDRVTAALERAFGPAGR